MSSRNSIYPLPRNGALSARINGFQVQILLSKRQTGLNRPENPPRHHGQPKPPRLSNCAKRGLPLPDSQIGALETPLSSAIIHGLLLY